MSFSEVYLGYILFQKQLVCFLTAYDSIAKRHTHVGNRNPVG